jgi:hypothetical protein
MGREHLFNLSGQLARRYPRMRRLIAVLITLWAGSLWTICGIVAPTLFSTLDDRHLAGRIAAELFRIETWLGLAVALLLVALVLARRALLPGAAVFWLIAVTAGAPLASELVLGPMMDTARAANDMSRFGMLHGAAAAMFLAACGAALALVWRVSRPAE